MNVNESDALLMHVKSEPGYIETHDDGETHGDVRVKVNDKADDWFHDEFKDDDEVEETLL